MSARGNGDVPFGEKLIAGTDLFANDCGVKYAIKRSFPEPVV